MSRPRRRTSSRGARIIKRNIPSSTSDFEEKSSSSKGSNYFFRLSVNVQVYYMKIVFGFATGFIMGFFYSIPGVSSSWWFVPLSGLILIIVIVRRGFNYSPEDLSWPKLILLSGTGSLFISFIFTSTLVWLIFSPQNYITL